MLSGEFFSIAKTQLEAALGLAGVLLDPDRLQRVDDDARRRHRDAGPEQDGELDALDHGSSAGPGTPCGSVRRSSCAATSSSSGKIAPLESQSRQNISGSPIAVAAIWSSRSPSRTTRSPRVAKASGGGARRRVRYGMTRPSGRGEGRGGDAVVAALGRKVGRLDDARLEHRLDRVLHGRPPTPRDASAPPAKRAASCSLFCRYAMNSPLPRWPKPRSSTLRTRSDRLTLARIGLRFGSKNSSVIDRLGDPDRHDAVLAPDEERQRRLGGRDLEAAGARLAVLPLELRRGRVQQQLERRERREDPGLDGGGILVGELELIGRVELGVERDRLLGRPGQPQRLRPVGLVLHRLRLERALQRLRRVLQRDDAHDRPALGIDQHQPGAQQLRGSGIAAHPPTFHAKAA